MNSKNRKITSSVVQKNDKNSQIEIIKEIISNSERAEKSRRILIGNQTAFYKV